MTFVLRYLQEHLKIFIMQLSFVCIFAGIFYLYHLPLTAVLYPAFVCFLLGCIFTGHSIYNAYKKHKRLMAMQSLSGAAIKDVFLKNANTLERDYQQIIRNLCEEKQSMEDRMMDSHKEMIDYFTVWVHQIKIPITSMQLHLKAEDSKLSWRLTSDLLHIGQYVEMVLTYLRLGADTTDYVFRTVHLDKILGENIRKLRGDFIMKKLDLVYVPPDETVVSDEKWLSFVIEQILSNALKYTNEGSVTISIEKPKTLCISDTGIGISPEDIPRIFEKGYTGGNGHESKQASGLGLYLCRQICNRLGHEISVISEVGRGTTMRIHMDQYQCIKF